MMPDLGKYAADVLLAYGLSLGIIVALIGFVIRRARVSKRILEDVERG